MNAKAALLATAVALFAIAQATAQVTCPEVALAGRYIGGGVAVGAAAGGAGVGVGIAGAAAISAIIEKPEKLVWYLIFIALAEATAIYGLLIGLLLIL